MTLRRIVDVLPRWRFTAWLIVLWNGLCLLGMVALMADQPGPCSGGGELCNEPKAWSDLFMALLVVAWLFGNAVLTCVYALAVRLGRARERRRAARAAAAPR